MRKLEPIIATTRKRTARRTTATRSRVSAPPKPDKPTPAKGERVWLLEVPYEERSIAQHLGARYFSSEGWAYLGTALPHDLERYRPKRYSWAEWRERTLRGEITATTPSPAPDPTTGTFTLRKDQLQDVKKVLIARQAGAPESAILSDVGVGKTAVAIAAIKRMANVKNVLVVCPLVVAEGWRQHLRQMGDGGMNWCIVNYESTKKLLEKPESAKKAKKTRTQNLRIVKEGVPRVQWDVVVEDESHYCSNPESQRTRVMDRVISGPAHHSAFKINLSATVGLNPAKLSYLHRAFYWKEGRAPLPRITADAYVEWCARNGLSVFNDSYGDALVWDPQRNGSNPDRELDRMHTILFGGETPWAFRRIPDWPEQKRIPVPVELSWTERDAYNADWRDFQRALADIEKKLDTAKDAKAKNTLRASGRAQQIRYRQKAGQVRAAGTASFVAEMVSKGYQVAISAEYLGTVERLREELERRKITPALFTGENRTTREEERIAYQRGQYKVIIYTPTAGFNLHAGESDVGGNDVPRVTVVAEPRWSPVQALQAEGRGQRNGNSAPVYYTFAAETIEEQVIHRCVEGMKNIGKINGDDTTPFAGLKEALGIPQLF